MHPSEAAHSPPTNPTEPLKSTAPAKPTGPGGSLLAALLEAVRPADRLTAICYGIGGLLVASGLFHVAVFLIAGGSWLGPVSFRKAVTFGLSFGLTVLTLTSVLGLLGVTSRARARALPVFVTACVLEVALVTMQAWRGVPSHFNRDSAFDSAVSTGLAAGGATIVLSTLVLTATALRAPSSAPPVIQLAVRAGFLIFLFALAIGAVMIAHGVALQRSADASAAYHQAGSLKAAHAAPMHAILVLPAIAWLLTQGPWSQRVQLRLGWTAVTGYAAMVLSVLAESLAGTSTISATTPVALLSALGLGVVIVVGVVALARAGAVRSSR